MDSEFKQTPEWEELFYKCINQALDCPALSLCYNNLITPEKIEDAAGNHVFDDYYPFWKITESEGHSLRAVFQRYSTRNNPNFKQYIQSLIDYAREWKISQSRLS